MKTIIGMRFGLHKIISDKNFGTKEVMEEHGCLKLSAPLMNIFKIPEWTKNLNSHGKFYNEEDSQMLEQVYNLQGKSEHPLPCNSHQPTTQG